MYLVLRGADEGTHWFMSLGGFVAVEKGIVT